MFRAVTMFCYMVALLSVILAVVITLFLIWKPEFDREYLYRGLLTCATFIVASLLVLTVNATFRRALSKHHDDA